MAVIELTPRGPFDLRLMAGFGFGPETGQPEPREPVMRLAFCLDDLRGHAGVVLHQEGDGVVRGAVEGDGEPGAVKAQLARILSLDHDGKAWMGVGRRDRVIAELQRRYPGLRPRLFHSPTRRRPGPSSRHVGRRARRRSRTARSPSASAAPSRSTANGSRPFRRRGGCWSSSP
jgi:hypothetical protein